LLLFHHLTNVCVCVLHSVTGILYCASTVTLLTRAGSLTKFFFIFLTHTSYAFDHLWHRMADGLCCADGSLRNYLLTLRYKPGLVQAGSSKPPVSDTNRLFNWYQLTACDVVSNAVSSVLRTKNKTFFCPVFGRCHRILLP